MMHQYRQAAIVGAKLIGLTIIIFVAPLMAWLLLMPYVLGAFSDQQRQRMQRWIAIVLSVLIIFFGTPAITLLPYSLARPLAKLKITTLNHYSRSLTDLIAPTQPLIQSVAPADRDAYAEFLGQPGTGIMRLGGEYPWGWFNYDFVQGTPDGDRDIRLNEGSFEVGFAGRDTGLFINLGSGDIAAIDRNDARIQALMTIAPPVQEFYDRARSLEEHEEATVNGVTYHRSVDATLETVYALRSIMPSDTRDIVVALKVVRKDSDGSLIVVWKMLANLSSQ